jgi:glycosyltransferase involved in cell wall biosynthesis
MKLLLITHNQFGHQTDFYKYAQYLRDKSTLQYLCFDQQKPRIEMPGIDVSYLTMQGHKILVLVRFIRSLIRHIRREKPEIVVCKYFPLCTLLLLASRKTQFVLDIRSASVTTSSSKNTVSDFLIRFAYRFFDHTLILSESLRERLRVPNAYVLPLGADSIDNSEKSFHNLRLLYVGTLNNRNIVETLFGIIIFLRQNPEADLRYTIIGAGSPETMDALQEVIVSNQLGDLVDFVGPLPYTALELPFKSHNIGVSFIPMTPYYDKQPPTKTYEYLMSGMAVIATATFENRRIVQPHCGVLIQDNAADFAAGLTQIQQDLSTFSSARIRAGYAHCSWEHIVNQQLYPFLKQLHAPKA